MGVTPTPSLGLICLTGAPALRFEIGRPPRSQTKVRRLRRTHHRPAPPNRARVESAEAGSGTGWAKTCAKVASNSY